MEWHLKLKILTLPYFQQMSINSVWQSVADSCSAGIYIVDYSHLLLSLTALHSVSEVCDIHPNLPVKLPDNIAWRAISFCLSFFPSWKLRTNPILFFHLLKTLKTKSGYLNSDIILIIHNYKKFILCEIFTSGYTLSSPHLNIWMNL